MAMESLRTCSSTPMPAAIPRICNHGKSRRRIQPVRTSLVAAWTMLFSFVFFANTASAVKVPIAPIGGRKLLEDCGNMTDTECYKADTLSQKIAEQQQPQYQRNRQRRRVQEDDDEDDDDDDEINEGGHGLVLLMRFTDHADRTLPPVAVMKKTWEERFPGWLKDQSFGKYVPTFKVMDWMDTDDTEEFYSGGEFGQTDEFMNSIEYLLEQLDQDASFDWSEFDKDKDGIVDELVVLHSGFGGESFQRDCYNQRPPNLRIWSHYDLDLDRGWISPTTGYEVKGYTVSSALDGFCDSNPALMGVLVTTYMHSLGLVSLFDQGDYIGKGIGKMDVMSYAWGNLNDGIPGALSAWSKYQLGWIEPIDVQENSYITLGPAARRPDAIIIQKPYAPFEYLMLENRQKVGRDKDLHGSGIAIYHIDEAKDDQSERGYPGKDRYPEEHYMVAVLPADGLYDLEKGNNLGDDGDFFKVGSELGPGMGDTVFPNTDGYQYGFVWENNLVISIVDECGANAKHMTVLIKFGGEDDEPRGKPECELPVGGGATGGIVGGRPSRPPRTSRPTVLSTPRPTNKLTRPPRPPRPSPTDPPVIPPTIAPTVNLLDDSSTRAPTMPGQTQAPSTAPPTSSFGAETETPLQEGETYQPTYQPTIEPTMAPAVTTTPTVTPTTAPNLTPTPTIHPTTAPALTPTPTTSPTLRPADETEGASPTILPTDESLLTQLPTDAPVSLTINSPTPAPTDDIRLGSPDETTTDGYDLPGETIQGPAYTVSTGSLLRLPNRTGSLVPAATDPPLKVEKIEILERASAFPTRTGIWATVGITLVVLWAL